MTATAARPTEQEIQEHEQDCLAPADWLADCPHLWNQDPATEAVELLLDRLPYFKVPEDFEYWYCPICGQLFDSVTTDMVCDHQRSVIHHQGHEAEWVALCIAYLGALRAGGVDISGMLEFECDPERWEALDEACPYHDRQAERAAFEDMLARMERRYERS